MTTPEQHERTHAPIGVVLAGAAALTVLGVAVFLGVDALMRRFGAVERHATAGRSALLSDDRGQFPTPRLQRDDAADMEAMRRADEKALNEYGWVDRQAGVASIPITRAMELLAKRGLPTRKDK